MFSNYLKIALRLIRKNIIFSFINILGLAIGMACCIIILLFVQFELSFDKFHENADQIYRLVADFKRANSISTSSKTSSWLVPDISKEFPEIQEATRIFRMGSTVRYKEKQFNEIPVLADSNILNIFSFPLIHGDKNTALQDPNSLVITEETAKKYFGDNNPVGEIVTINNKLDCKITGVLKNIPHNSHFRFDILGSFELLKSMFDNPRSYNRVYSYLRLKENSSATDLGLKIQTMVVQNRGENYASRYDFHLQPMTSIHLKSNRTLELSKNSNISYSFILAGIALLILLIACVNFINLSTARASRRAKEVGLRKVIGANKKQLIRQFFGETLFFSIIALIVGLVLAELFLPNFNSLVDRNLEINLQSNFILYAGLSLLTIFVGVIAGGYPAIFLSSFSPSEILRNKQQTKVGIGRFIRKGLVIFQFTISIVFIIGTITVIRQISFVNTRDLGFIQNDILEAHGAFVSPMQEKYKQLKSSLLQNPKVLDVSGSEISKPGSYAGFNVPIKTEENQTLTLYASAVDFNYIDFFEMEIIKGRNFEEGRATDIKSSFIINEKAVQVLGWENPIGQRIANEDWGIEGTIIGVVKDFHNTSLYEEIKPTIFYAFPQMIYSPFVKIQATDTQKTIGFVQKTFSEFYPNFPVYYSFLEDNIARAYQDEAKVFDVFKLSSILSIIIACLGLFGLISFSVEQRKKEIGIRKILGASLARIIGILSFEFTILVIIANLISWPIAYLIMKNWLQGFAYRIDLGILSFFAAGIIALIIALLTMGYQALKAGLANPIKSLRYE